MTRDTWRAIGMGAVFVAFAVALFLEFMNSLGASVSLQP